VSHQITLIRHGSIGCDLYQRLIGSTDVPLSEEGRRQSQRLTAAFQERSHSTFYCSPLRRARETARAALDPYPAEMVIDPDLREIDFGQWEGMTFEQVNTRNADAVSRWASGAVDFTFPGGETIADFAKRVERAARRMAADETGTVVAFTHGGVIRHLICHYLGLPFSSHRMAFDVRYALITTVELFDGKGVLTGLNLAPAEKV
jgi:alpha-ribazole phosphatase